MDRAPGLSVRLKLTLSYAGFLMLAGGLLLAAVWVFLLRYVPRGETVIVHHQQVLIRPGRGDLLRDFAPAAAILLAFLWCSVSWEGGFSPAGCSPLSLASLTPHARPQPDRSPIESGYRAAEDEFRELADAFDTMLGRLETHSRRTAEIRGQRLP